MTLPPGPSTPKPLLLVKWMRKPFEMMRACRDTYGESFTIQLVSTPKMVFLSNPDHVKEVFQSAGDDMHAGKISQPLKPFLGGRSVILLDGQEHRQMRRLVMPPFHGERMHAYGQQMIDVTHDTVDRWRVGEPFPVHESFQAITLDIILRTVFGLDEDRFRGTVGAQLTTLTQLASWPPLLLPQMQHDLGPWSPWGKFVRASEVGNKLLFEVIDQRRAAGTRGRTDILSLLLDARDEDGKALDAEVLRDQLVTLLVAGHETTATSLAWTMRWVLALPRVRDRMLEELHAALREGPLTPDRIAKLPYLDAVIRESLRLQPVIPLVGRVLQEPMNFAGYDLPAGVCLTPSVYLVHQNPAIYDRPEQFDPQRFIDRQYKAHEWIPFGGGIRKCIGMAFALYEMKMVLATMLTRAWMRTAPGYVPRLVRRSITLTPSEGMPVVVDAVLPRARFVADA